MYATFAHADDTRCYLCPVHGCTGNLQVYEFQRRLKLGLKTVQDARFSYKLVAQTSDVICVVSFNRSPKKLYIIIENLCFLR